MSPPAANKLPAVIDRITNETKTKACPFILQVLLTFRKASIYKQPLQKPISYLTYPHNSDNSIKISINYQEFPFKTTLSKKKTRRKPPQQALKNNNQY